MAQNPAQPADDDRPQPAWYATLIYARVGAFAWLVVALFNLFIWFAAKREVARRLASDDIDGAGYLSLQAGSKLVDAGYAFAAVLVFGFVAYAVARRSWNLWDYATLAIGFGTALSSIFLCAIPRLMFLLPLTGAPLWALLYTRGTRLSCGVKLAEQPQPATEAPVSQLSRDEIEREIARERTLIAQLGQNLDVFEVERAMDTDVFVRRYSEGLEEENADNAEWFSIARAVRRHRERLQALSAQLESVE
jgi:hypothetical protein